MAIKFMDDLNQNIARVNKPEEILGNTLNIPFAASDSGARKILANKQKEQSFLPIHGEIPIISTGYENKFGDKSSSIIELDDDYQVVAKISKFNYAPDHHYYLIMENIHTHELTVHERISYKYKSEVYGYLYNNTVMDTLQPGNVVHEGSKIRTSVGYDKYNNKTDGLNALTLYISDNRLMEDATVLSESFAKRLSVPLFHFIRVIIPPNMIPLNLYGTDDRYKSFPDVGELVKDGMAISLRLEKNEEALFSQAYDRLKESLLSDEPFGCNGRVIDVDIYCNNEQLFDNPYTAQLKAYYDDKLRMCRELVSSLIPYLSRGYKMSYELTKLYYRCNNIINGEEYTMDKTKPINNIILDLMILEEDPAQVCDKVADRHGGKGVISFIVPDDQMPKYNGKTIDILVNKSTMYNRENPGQMWELSCTFVGDEILRRISTEVFTVEESMNMILDYLSIVSPSYYRDMKEYMNSLLDKDESLLVWYINSIIQDGHINIVVEPISENMTIFKLNELYKRFPFVQQVYVDMPQKDSNGNIRFIKSRRKLVPAYKYMYRLKQYAKEKFMVTSLAATTIKNENTRSHASKYYQKPFNDTPVKFIGYMEADQCAHMGIMHTITLLMLHSLSPHGRRLTEQMYTGDPFNIDIKLDPDCSNREVEILNAYLLTMGLELVFTKRRKNNPKMLISPFTMEQCQDPIVPFTMSEIISEEESKELYKMMVKNENFTKEAKWYIDPIEWDPFYNQFNKK